MPRADAILALLLAIAPAASASAHTPATDTRAPQCQPGDTRLNALAELVRQRAAQGRGAPSAVELGELLRAQGEPHAKARAWTLTTARTDEAAIARRKAAWLATLHPSGALRCGTARGRDARGGESIAVVAVDVLADLRQDLPLQVRTGAWVTVDAEMKVRASGAKVVTLGPRGMPHTILTSFDRTTGQIVARFRADSDGAWLVQVLADIDVGPMPVLEARVNAGDGVHASAGDLRAPGEEIAASVSSDEAALLVMLDAARVMENLGALERDPQLDRVAASHVAEMIAAGRIGHDVGDGSPPERIHEAGVSAREAGENVAKAPTAILAHRALWWSPSHRANMLFPRYSRVGVAARRDADGVVWVTEVFAD